MLLQGLWQFPHFLWILAGIIVSFLGIIPAIVYKRRKPWFLIHKIITAVSIVLMAIGIISLGYIAQGFPHAILGLVGLGIYTITLIIGFISLKIKKKSLRMIHIWGGRIGVFLLLITLILGIVL